MSATSNTRTPASEVLHQCVQRVHDGRTHFGSQVRIDLSGPRAAMPEILLDVAEIHSGFQQMCRIGMSKTVNVSPFRDAGRRQSAFERLLQTGGGGRMNGSPRLERLQAVGGGGKHPRF